MEYIRAATEDEARYVKRIVRAAMARPWSGRGIGTAYIGRRSQPDGRWTTAGPGEPCCLGVVVWVQKPEHVALVRERFGDLLFGVPIAYEAVGDFVAQPAKPRKQPPTSPPPFGNHPGHIGGSYDWWWWAFGRPSGIEYDPPDPDEEKARNDTIMRRVHAAHGAPSSGDTRPLWMYGPVP